jgi:hypothetical protein
MRGKAESENHRRARGTCVACLAVGLIASGLLSPSAIAEDDSMDFFSLFSPFRWLDSRFDFVRRGASFLQ